MSSCSIIMVLFALFYPPFLIISKFQLASDHYCVELYALTANLILGGNTEPSTQHLYMKQEKHQHERGQKQRGGSCTFARNGSSCWFCSSALLESLSGARIHSFIGSVSPNCVLSTAFDRVSLFHLA